ncbi:hypothetical protein ACOSQ2_019570 [Xanthoceras sorbifolium]
MYLLLLGYLVILQMILTFVHLVVCFVHLPANERTKLTAQLVQCAFLGYFVHQKGFLCYDPHLRRIWISRNIIFLENQNFFTTYIDSPLPSTSFYALPLFTNSSADSETLKPLIVYQIRPRTTSNQVPAVSVPFPAPSPIVDIVPALPSAPLRHSTQVRRPPYRFGFTSPLSLTQPCLLFLFPHVINRPWSISVGGKLLKLNFQHLKNIRPGMLFRVRHL